MKENTGGTYLTTVNALLRFLKRDTLDISEVNVNFLTAFESFLESEPSQRGSNRKTKKKEETIKSSRAVSMCLGCIRAMHNLAKKEYNDEDHGLIRIPHSPFKKFKIKPQPKTRKRALTVKQMQAIINLPYDGNSRRTLAKDCIILSFALIGLNSVDMYYAGPLKRNVLVYNRRKTTDRRDDSAEMRVQVDSCVALLMEKYKDKQRLFNFYKRYSTPNNFNRAINIGLKVIGKEIGIDDLEFYAGRHTWATLARSAELNVDKATVHEALNHMDSAMKVTDIYIDKDWSVIWNANKKVLSLFDWSAVGYDLL
jgi:integrase